MCFFVDIERRRKGVCEVRSGNQAVSKSRPKTTKVFSKTNLEGGGGGGGRGRDPAAADGGSGAEGAAGGGGGTEDLAGGGGTADETHVRSSV